MKRILAACVLLLVGSWAAGQVNGQGGVYINGVLQGGGSGAGTVTSVGLTLPPFMNVSGTPITTSGTFLAGLANVSAGAVFAGPASGGDAEPDFRALLGTDLPIGLAFTDPTTDAAPTSTLLKSANAFPGATSNTTGANTILAGGIGRRIYTVVAYDNATMALSTVTVTVNGTATVLTEGTEWDSITSNNATATSLAAAIDALSGVSAVAASAVVRITPDVGTYSLTIAKTAADAGMTATSGADGVISTVSNLNQYAAAGDANPTASLGDGALVLGAGGASAVDAGIQRSGAGVVKVTDGGAGSGSLDVFGIIINPSGTIRDSFYQFLIDAPTGLYVKSGWNIFFAGGANYYTTIDTGLSRFAPGVVKVTDGSTGWGSAALLSTKFFDGGTHYTTLQAQTQTADITLTLPPIANVSGTLRNDGTGSLTWDHNQLVDQFTYTFFDLATDLPATLDVPSIYVNRARAIHITEVYCEADTADGAVINLTNAGDTVLSGDLTCTTAGAASTSFVSGKDAVALNAKLSHVMVSVLAGLKRLNVVVRYSAD